MESDHHRSGSELFICFTSRNSSSMKISSKSIRSPGRTERFKEPSLSLSSSITRRLRSKNRSMKSSGQASPMFPTGSNKKKGSSFETAEPSSPKVTCIGQVRVKTKKQGQKMRRRSKSRRGEVSFRKTEQIQEGILHHQQQQQQQECLPHRNQRWVHLPLSICEALRAFGAEFSCLLPCKPSCWRGEKGKNERKIRHGENTFVSDSNSSSCRAIFAKWVVTSMEENEEGNERRDMELVREEGMRREKREIVGEIEMQISEEKRRISTNKSMLEEEEEEERRVSICIPPRNALLLMRCRSEPLRMSALANRFWESPIANKEDEDEEEEKQDAVEVEDGEYYKVENFEVVLAEDEEDEEEEEKVEDERIWGSPGKKKEIKEDPEKEEEEEGNQRRPRAGNPEIAEVVVDMQQKEEERIRNEFSLGEFLKEEEEEEAPKMKEILERERVVMEVTEERVESRRVSFSSRRVSVSSARTSFHSEEEELVSMIDFGERIEDSTEVVGISENQERERETTQILERETIHIQEEISSTTKEKIINNPKNPEEKSEEKSRTDNLLPDCLLLMMCEPKLSMEVSKETWVCGTDFIRYRPETKAIQKDGGDEPKKRLSNAKDESKRRLSNAGDESKRRLSNGGDDLKRRLSTDSNPGRPPLPSHHSKNQTPRRSCSKPSTRPEQPAAPPMVVATPDKSSPVVAEEATKAKKLVVYEPLVLTRCKSEPVRSSAKLAPEACCWRDMKLEPQSLGVGATGIGF